MRVSGICVFSLELPLPGAGYTFAKDKQLTCVDTTLVSVETDAGINGCREGCRCGATYLPAFGRGVRASFEEMVPQLLGRDPRLALRRRGSCHARDPRTRG
jgi:hypothetical protein